jgi:hypothetical protein
MNNFIPSESQSGVEQLQRSVIATQNVARLRRQLESEPDEFTRSRLLKLLLLEAEKSRLTRQQLDRIVSHMAELAVMETALNAGASERRLDRASSPRAAQSIEKFSRA